MPIYEYECMDCNKTFEVVCFPGRDDEEPECSQCKSKNVKKLISAGAIRPEGIPTGKGGFKPPPPSCGGSCSGCKVG